MGGLANRANQANARCAVVIWRLSAPQIFQNISKFVFLRKIRIKLKQWGTSITVFSPLALSLRIRYFQNEIPTFVKKFSHFFIIFFSILQLNFWNRSRARGEVLTMEPTS